MRSWRTIPRILTPSGMEFPRLSQSQISGVFGGNKNVPIYSTGLIGRQFGLALQRSPPPVGMAFRYARFPTSWDLAVRRAKNRPRNRNSARYGIGEEPEIGEPVRKARTSLYPTLLLLPFVGRLVRTRL